MKPKLLVVLAAGLLVAADPPKKPATDQDLIQGKWKMVSSERKGKQVTVMVTQVVITADEITFVGPDAKESFDMQYKLDPSKKPKAIDLKADETALGIYELDGDTLKICLGPGTEPRPTEFATKPGSDLNLIVLKREKP